MTALNYGTLSSTLGVSVGGVRSIVNVRPGRGFIQIAQDFLAGLQNRTQQQDYLGFEFENSNLILDIERPGILQPEELRSLYEESIHMGVDDEHLVLFLQEGLKDILELLGDLSVITIRDCVLAATNVNDTFVKHALEALSSLSSDLANKIILQIAEQTCSAPSISIRFTTLQVLEKIQSDQISVLLEYFVSLEKVNWIREYAKMVLAGPRTFLWES